MSSTQTDAGGHAAPAGPLTGVKVLDLTRVLAGPFCTMVLADLGARVIKVEQPGSGDDSRAYGPFHNGASAYFASLNRGKESIALNLKHADDRLIFEKLLSITDVLVENYRPGTMEKLGLGWDDLHGQYPRLIYAAASGFGHTGPYAKRAAYDMVVQAMGGIMSVTGHPGQPPVRVGTSVGDITAGLFTAIGINSALFHRAVTGEAIKIDVAMLDCQVAILENAISRYAATGEIAGPIGARHPSITPFAGFEAKDGWIIIAAGNEQLFGKLAAALGRPDLATDKRYATNTLRTEHWEPLSDEINAVLKSHSVEEWLTRLDAAGVPCGPINTIDKVLANAQVRSRNMVVTADDPETGRLVMAGNPIKLSAFADPDARKAAPKLDGDRAAILAQIMDRETPAAPPPALPARSVSFSAYRGPMRYLDQLRRAIIRDASPLPSEGASRPFIERAQALADTLLSEHGEVLGTVVAHDLVCLVNASDAAARAEFLQLLAERYGPNTKRIAKASDRWRADPSAGNLAALSKAVEPPRQELFRRMNMAPDGIATLLKLRAELLHDSASNPVLAPVDADLLHLFGSWFNRGFLELERIDWHTPAAFLEKLLAYEAVHAIDGWDDLRRRLASDRRCYGFFHPALPEEPLIFLEIALVNTLSDKIEPIIRAPLPQQAADEADTAIFYSISNCQPGLRGVSFGNFLIKQVVSDLKREFPGLKTFATLSPIPGFRKWLENPKTKLEPHLPAKLAARVLQETGATRLGDALTALAIASEGEGYARSNLLRDVLLRLCARYLTGAGSGPVDPVARFHLGNGASIERINWMADLSEKGIRESHGLMVNYLYDLANIEANHEAFANDRPAACSKAVAALIDTADTMSLKGQVDAAISRLKG
jgi:CoA:oxalate CoA-transferase